MMDGEMKVLSWKKNYMEKRNNAVSKPDRDGDAG
jgi:hypothetical protein